MCGMEVGIPSLASKVHCLSPLSSNHGAMRFLFQVLVGHDLLGLLSLVTHLIQEVLYKVSTSQIGTIIADIQLLILA